MKNILSIFLIGLVAIPNFCNAQIWTQKGTTLDGVEDWTYYTRSVDISADGNVVATGSILDDGNGIFTKYVKVYEWQDGTWMQRGNDIYTSGLYPLSAVSLSADGNTVAIGGSTDVEGHNYSVFSWDGSSWSQKGLSIGVYGPMYALEPAWATGPVNLSSDGNILAIGAPIIISDIVVDGVDDIQIGLAKVFLWNNGVWEQMGSDIMDSPSSEENFQSNFGHSLSLSSDGYTIAIGSPATLTSLNTAIEYFGSCRLFEWSGTDWLQKGSTIHGLNEDDRFGWSVSLSSDGNTVAVGAPINIGTGQYEGSVRIFSWTGSTWNIMGNSISGEFGFDYFGESVSLSSDGNTVAIGGPYNNGNGNNAGHVRIYQWGGSNWLQSGNDIDGQATQNVEGHAVGISSDGHSVVMGARENPEVDGENVRHVRVFSDISLGIHDNHADFELSVYPNPSDGWFTINQIGHLEVFNLLGDIIHSETIPNDGTEINLSSKAEGLYILQIETDQGNYFGKILIQDQ